jgi:tRNA modification GTPase
MSRSDTIIALATPTGNGAIAVLRISGPEAITKVNVHFKSASGKLITEANSHTLHLGLLYQGEQILDEVIVSLFKSPKSYTGEDVVEISCHGSTYIQQKIIQHFINQDIRLANPGEFTLRAFLNGKMDLSQAEAVADLIASENEASHKIAMQQMRGGFSSEIKELRNQLINFASLIALELDFSEEDVEFADRTAFYSLLERLKGLLKSLIDSFALGNVIKKGIPVAIAGAPNVGKSTLLNALLQEEKALVSDIAGTTRDAIEDEIVLDGICFRFIDTAGIRETLDSVESMGIERTFKKMEQASIILYILDSNNLSETDFDQIQKNWILTCEKYPDKQHLLIFNKSDLIPKSLQQKIEVYFTGAILISAKKGVGLEQLKMELLKFNNLGLLNTGDPVISNARHYEALVEAMAALDRVREGMDQNIPVDLVSVDINQALYHLGKITGEISTEDLLGNIFANFCIGK